MVFLLRLHLIAGHLITISATEQGGLAAFRRWCVKAFVIRSFVFIFERPFWLPLEIEISDCYVEAVQIGLGSNIAALRLVVVGSERNCLA